jgi:radical SAM PhpK family P-methyltransferase
MSGMRNKSTDCLIIGFNDANFEEYVTMVKSMGTDSGAYRDLNLAYFENDGRVYRSMDILNEVYFKDKNGAGKVFNNSDFLWPVVTYLGTYLSKRGLSFDYVNLFHSEKDKLREKLLNDNILAIAITTTLYVSPQPILEIISFIKEYNRDAKIILGGPYVSNQAKMTEQETAQSLFKYVGADFYVISSEGELALVNILNALKKGVGLDRVENIAYRKGGDYIFTAASIESNPLEENMVDYTLFPKDEFGEFVTLRTAKSCPFSCSFCGFPQRAGKYTYLGVDLVEKELNAIRDIGSVTTLTFIDDTFNVPKPRFKELMRMMIKNGYGYRWNSYLRSDHVDEEAIELMRDSGCEGVFLGAESGSDQMLQKMNKTSRRKDYLRVIPLLKQAGIATYTSLIIGFPGETYDTVRETIDFVEEAKPDFFRAQLWYCDPTTPIWHEREKYGVKGSAFTWSHDTMDARTSCDLIDKSFLSVEGSIWLPQFGFELWSVYYLQRKGMKLDQIKTLLKCFNAVIKERLLRPSNSKIDPGLMESLRASCRFDDTATVDMSPVEVYSGSAYNSAEKFWLHEFNDPLPALDAEKPYQITRQKAAERASLTCGVEESVFDGARAGFGVDLPELFLAAYSILLTRLTGRPEAAVAVAINRKEGEGVIPLKLSPSWGATFRDYAQEVQQKIRQAMRHQLFGFHILTNGLRMAEHGLAIPVFDAGYRFWESNVGRQEEGPDEALQFPQAVTEAMWFSMDVITASEGVELRFEYRKDWFEQETVEKLSSYLTSILKQAGDNPSLLLEEIVLNGNENDSGIGAGVDADEVFNF